MKGTSKMYSKKFRLLLIVIPIYIIYSITTVFQLDYLANFLSPLLAYTAFGILITHVLKHRKPIRLTCLSFSFACLSWAVADTIWAFYDIILVINPEDSILIQYIYLFTNIFITIGLIIFIISLLKKWNGIQLIIDTIFVSASTLFMFWIIFFNKNLDILPTMLNYDSTSALCIFLDVFIFICIAIWILSIRKGKIPVFQKVVFTGLILFVITDLYYYHLYFYNRYIPNSMIDSAYIGSLLMIAIGSYFGKELTSVTTSSNIGVYKRGLLLAIYPIVSIIKEGFVLTDLICFLLLIMLHQILTNYVQYSIKKDLLLKQEHELNIILEDRIRQRTEEIIAKNNELVQKNKELNFLSNQDTVTSLYNRRFFINALTKEVNNCPPNQSIGLLFIDIDRFKTINDMYGHQIGDEVIVTISKRLDSLHYNDSILARLGGDEFVIGISGVVTYDYLEQISNEILKTCSEEIEVDSYVFHVTVSIGIAIYPTDAKDAQALMRNADIAMYEAKAQGKNRYVSFNREFREAKKRKNDIELLLTNCNFDEEFELHYQPQFRIEDQSIVGAEALLRWNSPSIGPVSPIEFIAVAEEINLINKIGLWVLTRAISQSKIWNETYKFPIKVGINVSPKQLDYKNITEEIKELLQKDSIPPHYIDIEITENIALEGNYRIEQINSLFSGLGLSISVDDFGTGYSSLSYLKMLPFERIKIAKPLIDSIALDDYDYQIVKAIIQLASSLGMKTIAEGVESHEQFTILKELGCDEIQGFLLGKPVTADKFTQQYLKK